MMLLSTPLFAAETPLLAKVMKVTGCEAWVQTEPLPERGAVLTQVKNLASRITLLAKIVSDQQFYQLTQSRIEDLDTSLAKIAEDLIDKSPNAIKVEDLKEQLDLIEGRIINSLSDEQKKMVTVADVRSSVPPSEITEPGNSNQFGKPMGFKDYGPGQAKP